MTTNTANTDTDTTTAAIDAAVKAMDDADHDPEAFIAAWLRSVGDDPSAPIRSPELAELRRRYEEMERMWQAGYAEEKLRAR